MKLYHPVIAGLFVEVDSDAAADWRDQGWKGANANLPGDDTPEGAKASAAADTDKRSTK